MIKKIFSIKLLFFSILMLFATNTHAKRLMAEMSYATFYSPESGPFLETYMGVRGKSVVYTRNENGMYQGVLNITMIFRKDTVIKAFRKYDLFSPEQADTSSIEFNFIDQQRIALPSGIYELELIVNDKALPEQKYRYRIPIEILYDKQQVVVSGIEVIDSYKATTKLGTLTRGGFDIIPRVGNFYPASEKKLSFYAEIYNTDTILGSNERFIATWYLQPYESGRKLDEFSRFKVFDTKPVVPLLSEFDISRLPSGNYNLAIEIKDKNNKLVGFSSLFIQRSNPAFVDSLMLKSPIADLSDNFSANGDSLKDWVQSLYPIATVFEKLFIDNQAKVTELNNLRRFFNHFWEQRSELDPHGAWLTYYAEVKKVNKMFGNKFVKGYTTDRGRVYLQYGPPNTITDRPFDASNSQMTSNRAGSSGQDGGLVPYQIWHYYTIKNQRNKKFVFYNPHLAANDFALLHSDAQGEFYNPQWQTQLKRIQLENIDAGQNGFDGQSGRYYNDPF